MHLYSAVFPLSAFAIAAASTTAVPVQQRHYVHKSKSAVTLHAGRVQFSDNRVTIPVGVIVVQQNVGRLDGSMT